MPRSYRIILALVIGTSFILTATIWWPWLLDRIKASKEELSAVRALLGILGTVINVVTGIYLWIRYGKTKPSSPPDHPQKITVVHQHKEPRTHARKVADREAYLNGLMKSCCDIFLSGIDPQSAGDPDAHIHLEAVYTALNTFESENLDYKTLEAGIRPERQAISALAVLDKRDKLVLLGEPGSGKSTFAQFVISCICGQMLGNEQINLELLTAPVPDEKGEDQKERQPWDSRHTLLPVRVILRDLITARALPRDQKLTPDHLFAFLRSNLEKANLADYVEELEEELRTEGGYLFFDGLDEVPEADARRLQIKKLVEQMVTAYPRCRFLITSRTYAYKNQDWKMDGFAEAALAPFHRGQIVRFVQRWYQHVAIIQHKSPEETAGRAAALLQAIFSVSRIEELAQRPLLLTLIASLHAWHGGELPEKRERLYANTIDLLLDLWEKQRAQRDEQGRYTASEPALAEYLKTDKSRIRSLLEKLAFQAHAAEIDHSGTADIPEADLLAGLKTISEEKDWNITLLIKFLQNRAGILIPRAPGVYSFPHRSIQEYLAACWLTGGEVQYPGTLVGLSTADPDRWREVLLLAAAKVKTGQGDADWELAAALCPRPVADDAESAQLWGAHLAGLVLRETRQGEMVKRWHEERRDRIRDAGLLLIRRQDFPARERALAGLTLAGLGDPRPEVGDVDAMQFCLVPGGPFKMGGDRYDDEKPIHTCVLLDKEYWLARYPVTVAQFRRFVESNHHFKLSDSRCLSDPANHPVSWVSWHEALAFCRWLEARWRKEKWLPDDLQVTLPSEAEWEKAARGGLEIPSALDRRICTIAHLDPRKPPLEKNLLQGREYPWGMEPDPERANYDNTGINTTSAVGCFPGGTCPYGCEEMSGNVWEWTRSLNESYPYQPGDGREDLQSDRARVLRGGSWDDDRTYVRCALRFGFNPGDGADNIGFRVVLSPRS